MTLLERDREGRDITDLLRTGGVLVIEGGAGIGKTALVEVGCARAGELGYEVLRARGSELEAGFAYGVVRQLFERRLLGTAAGERAELLTGPAGAVRGLLLGEPTPAYVTDTSFAILHGLYWLATNLSVHRPVFIAVDDAHWADRPSLRWLAYLAPRLDGLPVSQLVTLRPAEDASREPSLLSVRRDAMRVARPALLSRSAVTELVRRTLGPQVGDDLCAAFERASGGNPFYLRELLRAGRTGIDLGGVVPADISARAGHAVMHQIAHRIGQLDESALGLAQSVAVLGDDCALHEAASLAQLGRDDATRLAAGLVRVEILGEHDPPRFLHPVIRSAVEASLDPDRREANHRAAARLLSAEGASAGRIAAHLMRVQSARDGWVVRRLRDAAEAAMETGAPQVAADLLQRALAEPPPADERVAVLCALARADASAGRQTALRWLEEALTRTADPRRRADIAREIAETDAALFRWADAVDVIERALAELGDADAELTGALEGELVVAGLHDARRAAHVAPALARLADRNPHGAAGEALAVARGMGSLLSGAPADRVALQLEEALRLGESPVRNWDTRAALLWSLVVAERFAVVGDALGPMLAEVQRSGSARGLVAVYSTMGVLESRRGALPEADAAARIALRILQEGDFAPGLAFAVTVLAEVSVEAGDLDEARTLLGLLPQIGWPGGIGTVLIPAARGRLALASGHPDEAVAEFQQCASMFRTEVWGMPMRDVGYLHARSSAAMALRQLGKRREAMRLAEAELADVRVFGGARALGIALRVAGLVATARRHGLCWQNRSPPYGVPQQSSNGPNRSPS